MQIRKGTETDIEEVAALYDAVNDYLESHTNYPGWRRGVYPTREDAAQGIAENNLFVAEAEGQIAGTFILRHRPEEAYALADWGNQLDYSEILVLYTFAVHPRFLRRGDRKAADGIHSGLGCPGEDKGGPPGRLRKKYAGHPPV